MPKSLLVSSSDIAELVDERLAVVSTWRNRFKDSATPFPEPAGGSPARPLFEFDSVRDWVSKNRPEKNVEKGLLKIQIWSAIRLLSDRVDQFDLVYWLHLELRARKAVIDDTELSSSSAVQTTEGYAREILGAEMRPEVDDILALIRSASSPDLIDVSDFALARLSAGYGRSGGDIGAVRSNISAILAAASLGLLNVSKPTATVYDPACGIGETLIAIVEEYERVGFGAVVYGTEMNPRVAAIASTRFDLRDISATIATADSLSTRQFEEIEPDFVVVEPPLGLKWAGVWATDDPRSRFGVIPTKNSDLVWVVEAVARLKGDARALVLTSMGALDAAGTEEKLRASLIRSGAVKAIISLPSNLLQYSSVPLALWILTAPTEDDESRSVTVLDASESGLAEGTQSKQTAWIREHITSWTMLPSAADPLDGVKTAVVYLHDFLDEGMDLTPSRWTDQPVFSGVVEELAQVFNVLTHRIQGFDPVVPNFDELPTAQHVVTVKEMTEFPDSRDAKLWTGRGAPQGENSADIISTRDLGRGVLPKAALELQLEPGFRTEPGDVVFTTISRVVSLVDFEGGRRLGKNVHALRLEPSSRFEPGFVALCLAARWNERHQKGAVAKQAKPSELEIPLLPLEVQRRWVQAFQELNDLKSSARTILEWADDVESAAHNALRFGQGEITREF